MLKKNLNLLNFKYILFLVTGKVGTGKNKT